LQEEAPPVKEDAHSALAYSQEAQRAEQAKMRADRDRIRWEILTEKAERAYTEVARLDGDGEYMSREELVQAHGGDRGLFAKLDADLSGFITRHEWHAWLKETHAVKGAKGEQWLNSVLDTLLGHIKKTTEEEKKVGTHKDAVHWWQKSLQFAPDFAAKQEEMTRRRNIETGVVSSVTSTSERGMLNSLRSIPDKGKAEAIVKKLDASGDGILQVAEVKVDPPSASISLH